MIEQLQKLLEEHLSSWQINARFNLVHEDEVYKLVDSFYRNEFYYKSLEKALTFEIDGQSLKEIFLALPLDFVKKCCVVAGVPKCLRSAA